VTVAILGKDAMLNAVTMDHALMVNATVQLDGEAQNVKIPVALETTLTAQIMEHATQLHMNAHALQVNTIHKYNICLICCFQIFLLKLFFFQNLLWI
jgi:hypothetical protein